MTTEDRREFLQERTCLEIYFFTVHCNKVVTECTLRSGIVWEPAFFKRLKQLAANSESVKKCEKLRDSWTLLRQRSSWTYAQKLLFQIRFLMIHRWSMKVGIGKRWCMTLKKQRKSQKSATKNWKIKKDFSCTMTSCRHVRWFSSPSK